MATPNLNKFYTWCVQTCNAPNVGYSLSYRAQQTVGGITYYDCSSFVYYGLREGGWTNLPSYPFTTYDMIPVLLAGGWHEVPANGTILAGDIGWNIEHTEVAYSNGQNGLAVFMGAHDDQYPTALQVSIGHPVMQGGVWVDDPTFVRGFDRIFRYGSGGATDYGYSVQVVSALAGNAWVESKVNPTVLQQSGTAFGLWQWDSARKLAMIGWLTAEGYSDDDPEGQMRYMVHEDFWQGSHQGITNLQQFLTSTSSDIDMLTEAFCNCWELPATPNLRQRQEFAQLAYRYIQAHANDSTITEWETVPMYYLSEAQALNNAVMMYRFFSAGGGGGGTPTERIKKMPVWMKIRYHY